MKKILGFFLIMVTASLAGAQVIVAPTILFMSNQSRFGTFIVMNRSDSPQEISISFRFGFPESDSLGNIRMQYDDSVMAGEHSCEAWLKGFPQKFILAPGQQQVVRLLVTPPANLSEGEYWTRLVTSSTPQAKVVDTLRTGITANITFVLQQVTTVIYRNGNANTSVNISGISVGHDSASVVLLVHVDRGGNSPFFGRISAAVVNDAGKSVYTSEEAVAVYRNEMVMRFDIPLSELHKGAYNADIKLDSDRNDIQADDLLKVPTVQKAVSFSVE